MFLHSPAGQIQYVVLYVYSRSLDGKKTHWKDKLGQYEQNEEEKDRQKDFYDPNKGIHVLLLNDL